MLAKAREIEKEAPQWESLSEGALRGRLLDLKQQFRRRPARCEELVPQALAGLREAAARHLGIRPYPVQLAGSLALHEGYLAEMATGEGKTLTASLAAVIHGWEGLPCHVITVNDYLAERDSRWMAPLYRESGLSVGCVTGPMDRDARREAYRQDVVYTTNKEIVADFLRDRLWLGSLQDARRRLIPVILGRQAEIDTGLVMRGIHFGIVDEADSILIDEAVTPLIISQTLPNDLFLEACAVAHRLSEGLRRDVDYSVDARRKEIELSPAAHRSPERARRGIRGSLPGHQRLPGPRPAGCCRARALPSRPPVRRAGRKNSDRGRVHRATDAATHMAVRAPPAHRGSGEPPMTPNENAGAPQLPALLPSLSQARRDDRDCP